MRPRSFCVQDQYEICPATCFAAGILGHFDSLERPPWQRRHADTALRRVGRGAADWHRGCNMFPGVRATPDAPARRPAGFGL